MVVHHLVLLHRVQLLVVLELGVRELLVLVREVLLAWHVMKGSRGADETHHDVFSTLGGKSGLLMQLVLYHLLLRVVSLCVSDVLEMGALHRIQLRMLQLDMVQRLGPALECINLDLKQSVLLLQRGHLREKLARIVDRPLEDADLRWLRLLARRREQVVQLRQLGVELLLPSPLRRIVEQLLLALPLERPAMEQEWGLDQRSHDLHHHHHRSPVSSPNMSVVFNTIRAEKIGHWCA